MVKIRCQPDVSESALYHLCVQRSKWYPSDTLFNRAGTESAGQFLASTILFADGTRATRGMYAVPMAPNCTEHTRIAIRFCHA